MSISKKITRDQPESLIQIHVAHHFRKLADVKKNFTFFHVPNGGVRSKREAAKLKAMGVLPGVHDLVFLTAGGGTLLIELKAKKGSASDAQKVFFGVVERLGHAQFLIKAIDGHDAITQITSILKAHGVLK